MIINMYSNGVSTREISEIIEKLYGQYYSLQTVSNITNVALEEIDKWHKRSLKKRYSVLYIDAMSIRIRRDMVFNESVYFIIRVDDVGHKEVLDFYIEESNT